MKRRRRARIVSVPPPAEKPKRVKSRFPPRAQTKREKEVEDQREQNVAAQARLDRQRARFGKPAEPPMRRIKE